LHVEIDDVRAEPPCGDLEGNARACAGLEEQVRDGASGQTLVARRQLAGRTNVELSEIEQPGDLVSRRSLQGDQMLQPTFRVALNRGAGACHVGGQTKVYKLILLRPAAQRPARRTNVRARCVPHSCRCPLGWRSEE